MYLYEIIDDRSRVDRDEVRKTRLHWSNIQPADRPAVEKYVRMLVDNLQSKHYGLLEIYDMAGHNFLVGPARTEAIYVIDGLRLIDGMKTYFILLTDTLLREGVS